MNNEAWDNNKGMIHLNHFERRIKRNNWGNLEEDGRGENP